MDLQLNNQVALVTASSKGLGKASALALAREGAKVVMSARSELLETAAAEIRAETGAEVVTVRGDVTQQADIDRMVQAALDHFGQIDILIANCGGPKPGGFLDLTPADWEAASNLTLMSVVRLCYAVVPHMLTRGSGSIVAIQSYSVKQPIDGLILSNSIRLAVIGLLKSLANELGPKGIRVNSLNPAWTWTERVEQLMAGRAARTGTTPEQQAAGITQAVPLGRMGTVEEFGRTMAWLASPAASFMHGSALMFDGGAVKAVL
jgi:3-oxoacyl-[acyl-carrier protein] reductase